MLWRRPADGGKGGCASNAGCELVQLAASEVSRASEQYWQ